MLMVSPASPWPATTGGLVRIEGILRQMARHFDLTFVAPRRADQEIPRDLDARIIAPPLGDPGRLRTIAAAVDPRRPYHAARYANARIASLVRRELATGAYDCLYSHFIYGVQYVRRAAVPVIVDQQNVDREYWRSKARHSPRPLRWYAAWNTRRTVRYESRVLPDIWAYVSVSDDDRRETRRYAAPPVPHFWVAPNGVDTARFTPDRPAEASSSMITLGYLGSMDLEMNVEAVERFTSTLLPRIRAALPGLECRFVVIGRRPAASLQAIARRTPGMTLSGTVDDVVPWLRRLDVLVSPLRIGAGTKLKVAEAMSCALPVVGSALAFAGLPGQSGRDYVQADDDDGFVDAVCGLAADPARRARIGAAARALTVQHLDWHGIGDRLAAEITVALAQRDLRGDG